MAVFAAACRDLPGERSLSNSAATLRHAHTATVAADWVRAGIMVYGSAPDHPVHDVAHWQLRPAMTLRSRLIAVQALQPGDCVGYGTGFHGQRADAHRRRGLRLCRRLPARLRHRHAGAGRRRAHAHRGPGLMDMITVDLAPVPGGDGFGSEVTLWGGARSDARLPIDEVAPRAGTIGYE